MFSNYISLSQTLIYITKSTTERSSVITFMPFRKRHCICSERFRAKQPCHQQSTLQTAFNNIKKSEKAVAVRVEAIRYLRCQNSVFIIWAVMCNSGVSHFFMQSWLKPHLDSLIYNIFRAKVFWVYFNWLSGSTGSTSSPKSSSTGLILLWKWCKSFSYGIINPFLNEYHRYVFI